MAPRSRQSRHLRRHARLGNRSQSRRSLRFPGTGPLLARLGLERRRGNVSPLNRTESQLCIAGQWYASFLNPMSRHDQARTQLLAAREIDPPALIIQMNMADPPFFARDYTRAVEYLEAILRSAPQFFPAMFNLGRAYVQLGKYPEAIAAFEKAIQY